MEGSRRGYSTQGRLTRKVAPLQLGTCATNTHVSRIVSIKRSSKGTASVHTWVQQGYKRGGEATARGVSSLWQGGVVGVAGVWQRYSGVAKG